jgi:hypothetical protein
VASALVLAAGLAREAPARADARSVAARVAEQWQDAGADATVLPSRFVFDEETILVPIPAPAAAAAAGRAAPRCTYVALVGARGLSFRARLSDAPVDPLGPPEPGARASSTAGVLELRRCRDGSESSGSDGPHDVRNVVLSAEAGRGAVEIIVAHADATLPSLGAVIPERTGGTIPPPPEAGPLSPVVGQDARAEGAEARARREGALVAGRYKVLAGDDGGGEEDFELTEGCHRIEVFGRESSRERPGRRFRLDVDAELRDNEHLLARDRTEAPDARLETCVGTPTRVTVSFAGALPRSDVLVTHGVWPLPARLPPIWGPVARSKMARVLFTRHVAVPAEDPVYLAQGSSGATPLPLSVETGACYVAVVGVARGRARQLQLRAFVGPRESTDERGAADEGALAAFCVRAHESARLEVFARGTGLSWGLALFRVKSGEWELGR